EAGRHLLALDPQHKPGQQNAARRKEQEGPGPEKPQLRCQPGKEPVRIKDVLAPVEERLRRRRRYVGLSSPTLSRLILWTSVGLESLTCAVCLQESLCRHQFQKITELFFRQRLVETFAVGLTDCRLVQPAIELHQQKVLFLAQLKVSAAEGILDDVPATFGQRLDDQLGSPTRQTGCKTCHNDFQWIVFP